MIHKCFFLSKSCRLDQNTLLLYCTCIHYLCSSHNKERNKDDENKIKDRWFSDGFFYSKHRAIWVLPLENRAKKEQSFSSAKKKRACRQSGPFTVLALKSFSTVITFISIGCIALNQLFQAQPYRSEEKDRKTCTKWDRNFLPWCGATD